ncbi:YIP1 family protein [Shewanella sp. D64]|uniref:Yip1 family protein n=1 Tax=unclassified Shewanella TaxID=196818 RepID=UPI0022BA54DC|nr:MULTISPECIES: Yip1 family protein [unclassified Shewanella]MEC4728345.1 YIP1 family protein [Shewanella sp. D64]MEC4737321.1 YIP1 family protein [Shewanella sp. E94]WBJ93697.1 YIP1 family protein [Shewanella sp. MTB7]
MILNHLMGLYTHPKEEWHTIEQNHEALKSSLSHVILVALIPVICTFIASTQIGWNLGVGELLFLTQDSAMLMSVGMYFGLIAGVFGLAYLAFWMAKTFDADPSYTQALELASYTATPLFMVGLAALYPAVWFVMVIGLFGLAYSVYLLYTGVPIIMNIPEEKGFIYASSVVTAGLVLLVALMAASVILWSMGFGPMAQ